MNIQNIKNEATSTEIADFQRIDNAAKVHTEEAEVPFVVIPDGYKIEGLEDLQVRPRRIRENLILNTVESFIEYVAKWKADNSVIFADENDRSLEAVLDYHDTESALWADHKANYNAKFSRELQAWMANNGKPLPQIVFAEFLEDRIADAVTPPGTDLLERALKLQIITKGVFGSAARLQTGEFSLQWSQENDKGTVEFPEKISLGIPLFHNGKAYKIDVRLRYRLSEGKVAFTYKLVDIEAAIEHAFAEVVSQVREGLEGVQILSGSR